jgi:hypothetical protein
VCICVQHNFQLSVRCQIPSVIDSSIEAECRVPQLDVRSVENSKGRPTTVDESTLNYEYS